MQQPLPADITYFRLKIIDRDGSSRYSAVVTIHSETVKTLSLVNSSATNQITIKHPRVNANSSVKIISTSGQLVATGALKTGVSLTSINIQKLMPGIYFVVIETGIDRLVTKFYK